MLFSSQLRAEAAPIFQAVYAHSFVRGIAMQNITPTPLINYVKQDIQYLDTYARVYGLAIAKSPTHSLMQLFHRRIDLVLHGELTAHMNFCKVAQVDYEALRCENQMAPSAHHYASHMLSTAHMGQLGDIIAVVLPCHWIYVDIATALQEELNPSRDHLFYDWISFYSNERMIAGLDELVEVLDQVALTASTDERHRMREAFLTSCQMEYKFFDMAFTLEEWPVKVETNHVHA